MDRRLTEEIAKRLNVDPFPIRPPSITWGEYKRDKVLDIFIAHGPYSLTIGDIQLDTELTEDEINTVLGTLMTEGILIEGDKQPFDDGAVYKLNLGEDSGKEKEGEET